MACAAPDPDSTAMKHQNHRKSGKMAKITESSVQQRAPGEILHPDSRALFRFWEGVRGENSTAHRKDIDLKQIKDLLPWLAILERHPLKPEYSWRLAGTGVCKVWNQDLTGGQFMADWDNFERDTVCRLMDNVIASHQPCVARFKAAYEDGEMLGIEMLSLPVTAASRQSTQILASVVPFRMPYWLGQTNIANLELSSVKMIWTEHCSQSPRQLPDVAREEHKQAAKPLFRVIDGGRKN